MEEDLSLGSDLGGSTILDVLNHHPESPQPVKKRKRGDYERHHDSLRTIEATTLPESRTTKPLTFVLIANLSRSQLPLAWLDSTSSTALVPTRLIFHAKLPNDLRSQCTQLDHHCLLVVRQAPNGRLYAVESIGSNVYLGCLLSGWVTEDQVLAGHGTLSEERLLERLLGSQPDSATGKTYLRPKSQHGVPAHPFRPGPKEPTNRRGVLARMAIIPFKEATPVPDSSILPDRDHRQRPVEPDQSQTEIDAKSAGRITPPTSAVPDGDTSPVSDKGRSATLAPLQQKGDDPVQLDPHDPGPPSVQTILETLRRQYLETLYISKTSLAYFAKGPLVRARTQIQSVSTSYLSDLAEFCRDSVIPTKKMQLKYRDSIMTILQSLAPLKALGCTEEVHKTSTKPRAKQKSGKWPKIGKDGLYPDEKEFIEMWWHARTLKDPDVPKSESWTWEMKIAMADLRTRETEMQIILILEALALEGLEKATRPLIKEEPTEGGHDAALIEVPQFKKKKRQDLRSELDLLIDSLCIWQTIGLEDISKFSDEAQKPVNGPDAGSKDRLRDFCSDTIIPFYSARLPEQCKAVCQKLGGPQITPKRPRKMVQKSLSSTGVLPRAVARPSYGSIPKRTLQRVLSEDQSSRHISPPILSRSSTAPLTPNLTLETTEPPQRPESRGGLQKSRSFANREIDLVSDVRTQEMKQKKLANLARQKQEIDAAINALRKPNRGLAAKEIADEIEKHRKQSAKVARRNGLGIQVDATPKKSVPNTARQGLSLQSSQAATRPLSEPSVNKLSYPSSTMQSTRDGHANDRLQRPTVKQIMPTTICNTPAHYSSKRSDPLRLAKRTQDFEIFNTGNDEMDDTNKMLSRAESLIQATPSANRVRPDMLTSTQNTPLRMRKSQKPVLFTAIEKTDATIDDVFKDAPEIPEQAGKAMARVMGGGSEMSIYDSLGWNDDFDD